MTAETWESIRQLGTSAFVCVGAYFSWRAAVVGRENRRTLRQVNTLVNGNNTKLHDALKAEQQSVSDLLTERSHKDLRAIVDSSESPNLKQSDLPLPVKVVDTEKRI